MKKLFRSRKNKILTGLIGGIGEYFDIDPTILRLLYALIILPTMFTGVIIYFIASLIVPQEPKKEEN